MSRQGMGREQDSKLFGTMGFFNDPLFEIVPMINISAIEKCRCAASLDSFGQLFRDPPIARPMR